MDFSPRKSASHINCCVFGCRSHKRIHPTVRFHQFPREGECKVKLVNKYGMVEEVDRRMAWIIACRSGKTITKHMTVCSKHFKPNNYFCNDRSTKRYLKKTAIPSINLPKPSFYTSPQKRQIASSIITSLNLAERTHISDIPQDDISTSTELTCVGPSSTLQYREPVELEVANFLASLSVIPHRDTEDKACQITYGDFERTFEILLDSDKKLNTLTGLPNFQLLDILVHFATLLKTKERLTY